jgi:glycine/D-amino acid oxidase-like deaminating enzyme
MSNGSIFHPDFKARPFWWEAHEPKAEALVDVPGEARVAIIGGGYAGLAAALQLAKESMPSSRSGAAGLRLHPEWRMVSGGDGRKRYSGKDDPARLAELCGAAADSFSPITADRGRRHRSVNGPSRGGRGPAPRALPRAEAKVEPSTGMPRPTPNADRDRQREEIGLTITMAGSSVGRAAHLHPAKYFAGLYRVARDRGGGVPAPVTKLTVGRGLGYRNRARTVRASK